MAILVKLKPPLMERLLYSTVSSFGAAMLLAGCSSAQPVSSGEPVSSSGDTPDYKIFAIQRNCERNLLNLHRYLRLTGQSELAYDILQKNTTNLNSEMSPMSNTTLGVPDSQQEGNSLNSLFNHISRKALYGWYLLVVFIFYVWYQAIMNVLYGGTLFPYNGLMDFVEGTSINFINIFLMFLLNTLVVFRKWWCVKSMWNIPVSLLLSQCVPVAINGLFLIVSFMLGMMPEVMWIQTFLINFMVFMINEIIWVMANYRRSQQMYENARNMAVQLEYNVLRAQVNPHFLFNSLNILYSLSHIDVPRSQEFILSLSRVYRYIITLRGSMVVSLSDEIDFLKSYIGVLTILYYDCFVVDISGEEKVCERQIVPFSLQLIIENVTKHNVINKENPMTVHIYIEDTGLCVKNALNLKNFESPKEKMGIGLVYLTELYRLHGKKFEYEKTDKEFIVRVPYI